MDTRPVSVSAIYGIGTFSNNGCSFEVVGNVARRKYSTKESKNPVPAFSPHVLESPGSQALLSPTGGNDPVAAMNKLPAPYDAESCITPAPDRSRQSLEAAFGRFR